MANIDITDQGGGSLSNGVLQLENGVAMDTTLRYVADQNNTKSQLLLATNATTVEGTLKIKTSNVEYLDVEDALGNNRFTISKAVGSQKVDLDFASNPTGSTTIVGAIRTYKDGISLSDTMVFREDGYVGIGETTSPSGLLHVDGGASVPRIILDADTNVARIFSFRTNDTQRWAFRIDGNETGTNAGSNFAIRRYNDAGTFIDAPFNITRSSGNIGVNTATTTSAKVTIIGSGSTSATNSLSIQNSSNNNLFSISDNGIMTVNDPSTVGTTLLNTRLNGSSIIFYSANTQLGVLDKGSFSSNSTITIRASLSGNTDLTIGASNTRARASLEVGNSDNSISNGRWTGQTIRLGNGLVNGEITEIFSANPTTFPSSQSDIFFYGGVGSGGNAGDIFIQHNNTAKRGNVIIGTNVRTASAILSIASTTQGFLPPRMTTAQKNAIATPAAGLVVYDTDLNKLCVYTTAWETITSV